MRTRAGFPWRAPTWPGGVDRPSPKPRTGAAYDTEWARRYGVRVARASLLDGLVLPAVHALAPTRVEGAERLETLEGPVVFAANHHSHLDTPVVLGALPPQFRHRTVVAAAADYFFDTVPKAVGSAFVLNAIPIERRKVSRRSADLSAELVDDGWNLLIFPEGGRSPDGWGQAFRGGAAYLAVRCRVPVVPTYVAGTGRVLAKGMTRPRRGPVTVVFGDAMRARPGDDARRFGPRIEAAVAALADEHSTDWWSARRRAARDATPPLTGPAAPNWRRAWALGERRPRARARRGWPEL